jgi:hypothetical protein
VRPQQIQAHLRKQPFVPFRLFMSDGSSYDVRYPEMAAVSRAEVVVGLDAHNGDVPDRFAYCDPVHVVKIEALDGNKPRRSRTKRE